MRLYMFSANVGTILGKNGNVILTHVNNEGILTPYLHEGTLEDLKTLTEMAHVEDRNIYTCSGSWSIMKEYINGGYYVKAVDNRNCNVIGKTGIVTSFGRTVHPQVVNCQHIIYGIKDLFDNGFNLTAVDDNTDPYTRLGKMLFLYIDAHMRNMSDDKADIIVSESLKLGFSTNPDGETLTIDNSPVNPIRMLLRSPMLMEQIVHVKWDTKELRYRTSFNPSIPQANVYLRPDFSDMKHYNEDGSSKDIKTADAFRICCTTISIKDLAKMIAIVLCNRFFLYNRDDMDMINISSVIR